MRWLIVLGLLGVAAPTQAARYSSPVAVDQYVMLGSSVRYLLGERPGARFRQTSAWLHLRGGVASKTPNTALKSQFGFEYGFRFGVTPRERAGDDRIPVGGGTRVGIAYRGYSFNAPFVGHLSVHFDLDLALGGARWWSDTVRFSTLFGGRLSVAGGEKANLELDYTIVPLVVTGAPGEISARRLEHRISVTAGAGRIGVGVWLNLSRLRFSDGATGARGTVFETAVSVGLEWRT